MGRPYWSLNFFDRRAAFPATLAFPFGLAVMLLLISCGSEAGSSTASPEANPTEVVDPFVLDAQTFAEDQDISLEEALSRLEAYQRSIVEIQPELETELADVYGGIWTEYWPEYKVVIGLTEGDESTVRRYVRGKRWAEFVEVRQVEHTLLELREDQGAANLAALAVRARVITSVDVNENRVELVVVSPELFLAALESAGIELPDSVEVMAADQEGPLPDAAQVIEARTVDRRIIYLPRQAPDDDSMEAQKEGRLIEENGCLRIESQGDSESFLVIWPHGSELSLRDERIEVLNGDGQIVALAGELTRMGGGAIESAEGLSQVDDAVAGMPIDGCPGPYWLAGELQTLTEQATPNLFVNPFTVEGQIPTIFIEQLWPSAAEGILSGKLEVDIAGCLRVDEHVIFWPPHFSLRADPLRIIDDEGTEIAQLGQTIQLEGVERTPEDYLGFGNMITCLGPYWGAAAVAREADE